MTFRQIAERAERDRFDALPTTQVLDDVAVDAVRGLAGCLLDASPAFRAFVGALQ